MDTIRLLSFKKKRSKIWSERRIRQNWHDNNCVDVLSNLRTIERMPIEARTVHEAFFAASRYVPG